MQYIIIKITTILSILLISGCTDILSNKDSNYNSIHLKGGGWLQFDALDVQTYLENNFSLQLWISGDSDQSNDSKTIISILNEDNNNEIILGLFRNTSINEGIDIYLNNNFVETINNENLDWTKTIFNLITITSELADNGNKNIKIFINDTEVFSQENINIQIGQNDLIVGAKVNTSKTIASNFWTGYIDEIRFWDTVLTNEEISFHFVNSSKLIATEDDISTEDIVEGSYEDTRLCNLIGLWRFNYSNPTSSIRDESCLELNLSSGSNNAPECNECQEIHGIIYTLPGSNVEFSKISL